jgi:hypothetical protein
LDHDDKIVLTTIREAERSVAADRYAVDRRVGRR